MAEELFTIGHSNLELDAFREHLRRHSIDVVADVRSQPSSRYNPQFNRPALAREVAGVARYAYLGDSLGGRPPGREFYDAGGHVLYGPLSRSPAFLAGIEQLERNAARYRIAVMCSEANPLGCHRFLLVSRVLAGRGWPPDRILHILGDGSVRSEQELAFQSPLWDEAWTSPLSVSPNPAPAPSLHA